MRYFYILLIADWKIYADFLAHRFMTVKTFFIELKWLKIRLCVGQGMILSFSILFRLYPLFQCKKEAFKQGLIKNVELDSFIDKQYIIRHDMSTQIRLL